jgi:hypothetical protein
MHCLSRSSIFKHPNYIRQTVQTVKFITVEPSPLTNLIPLGPKYTSQDSVLNTLSLLSSLNVRDNVLQTFNTTGNIIVSYILICNFLGRSREDEIVWTE